MKNILTICALFLMIKMSSWAQTYPYWDSTEPGEPPGYDLYFFQPIVATTNAVFAVAHLGTGATLASWQKCAGFQSLGGITVAGLSTGTAYQQKMMCIHGHYLYAVGFFGIPNYTVATRAPGTRSPSVIHAGPKA
jgi:hypothetical protein